MVGVIYFSSIHSGLSFLMDANKDPLEVDVYFHEAFVQATIVAEV